VPLSTILIVDFRIVPSVWYFRIVPSVRYFFNYSINQKLAYLF